MVSPSLRFSQATIAGGGVIPHIHKSLINKTPGLGGPKVRAFSCACLHVSTMFGMCHVCHVRSVYHIYSPHVRIDDYLQTILCGFRSYSKLSMYTCVPFCCLSFVHMADQVVW
jgi:hypothetical protein